LSARSITCAPLRNSDSRQRLGSWLFIADGQGSFVSDGMALSCRLFVA
jgi:hypothetical protein